MREGRGWWGRGSVRRDVGEGVEGVLESVYGVSESAR